MVLLQNKIIIMGTHVYAICESAAKSVMNADKVQSITINKQKTKY